MDGVGLLEEGAFVTVNDELATSFGYETPDSLIGTSWRELYPQTERVRIENEVLPMVRIEQRWRGAVEGRREDGSTFPQTLSIHRTTDGRLAWVVRDRSERADHATVERAPLEPDPRDDRALPTAERAPVPVLVITAEGGIVYCNGEAVELLGADGRSAVLGRDPERFVHPEQRDRARQRIHRIVEDREPTEPVAYRLLGADGQERHAEISGAPTTYEGEPAAYVLVNDVTKFERTRERLRRERERYETIVETVDDGIYALDSELRFSFVNEGFAELVGHSREELLGQSVYELLTLDDEREFADEVRRHVVAGDVDVGTVRGTYSTSDGERVFETHYRLHPEPDGEFRGSIGVLRDVTEREERRRVLERNLEELATLDRINRILLETTRDLIRTANRGVIEQTVCTQLAASDLYQFAWVGERGFDGDRVTPRTTAGDDRGFLNAVPTGGDGSGREPAASALGTGEVQVVRTGDSEGGPWHDAAVECGFESCAAIPLRHEDTSYGVLVVHTERERAFNDRERNAFAVLGRTVGYIVNAIGNRKLLLADTVLELEFDVTEADSVLTDVAAALDCELVLEGYVASDDRWVLYVDAHGAPPGGVAAAAAEHARVERARAIGTRPAGNQVELTVAGSSFATTVTHAGVTVKTATATPNETRFVVEAPAAADVREIVDQIQTAHPNVSFVAQRERDREVTNRGVPDGVLGELTERQRETLVAAYRSGYFAWPRESTAEEIAESLDLASATLHGHLRKAQGTIISSLLESE